MSEIKNSLFNDGMLNAFSGGWECQFDRWYGEEVVEQAKKTVKGFVADPVKNAKKLGSKFMKVIKNPKETFQHIRNKVENATDKADEVITAAMVETDMGEYQTDTPWKDLVFTRQVPTGNKDPNNQYYPPNSVWAYHAGRTTKDAANYIKHNPGLCFGWALLAMVGLSRPLTFATSTLITGAVVQLTIHRPSRLDDNQEIVALDKKIQRTYKEKINPFILTIAGGMAALAVVEHFRIFTLPTAAWQLTSLTVGTQAGLWLSDWAVEISKVYKENGR